MPPKIFLKLSAGGNTSIMVTAGKTCKAGRHFSNTFFLKNYDKRYVDQTKCDFQGQREDSEDPLRSQSTAARLEAKLDILTNFVFSMTCYPAAPCDSADMSQEWPAAGVWETFETELRQDECVEAQPQEVFLEAEPQETNDAKITCFEEHDRPGRVTSRDR